MALLFFNSLLLLWELGNVCAFAGAPLPHFDLLVNSRMFCTLPPTVRILGIHWLCHCRVMSIAQPLLLH